MATQDHINDTAAFLGVPLANNNTNYGDNNNINNINNNNNSNTNHAELSNDCNKSGNINETKQNDHHSEVKNSATADGDVLGPSYFSEKIFLRHPSHTDASRDVVFPLQMKDIYNINEKDIDGIAEAIANKMEIPFKLARKMFWDRLLELLIHGTDIHFQWLLQLITRSMFSSAYTFDEGLKREYEDEQKADIRLTFISWFSNALNRALDRWFPNLTSLSIDKFSKSDAKLTIQPAVWLSSCFPLSFTDADTLPLSSGTRWEYYCVCLSLLLKKFPSLLSAVKQKKPIQFVSDFKKLIKQLCMNFIQDPLYKPKLLECHQAPNILTINQDLSNKYPGLQDLLYISTVLSDLFTIDNDLPNPDISGFTIAWPCISLIDHHSMIQHLLKQSSNTPTIEMHNSFWNSIFNDNNSDPSISCREQFQQTIFNLTGKHSIYGSTFGLAVSGALKKLEDEEIQTIRSFNFWRSDWRKVPVLVAFYTFIMLSLQESNTNTSIKFSHQIKQVPQYSSCSFHSAKIQRELNGAQRVLHSLYDIVQDWSKLEQNHTQSNELESDLDDAYNLLIWLVRVWNRDETAKVYLAIKNTAKIVNYQLEYTNIWRNRKHANFIIATLSSILHRLLNSNITPSDKAMCNEWIRVFEYCKFSSTSESEISILRAAQVLKQGKHTVTKLGELTQDQKKLLTLLHQSFAAMKQSTVSLAKKLKGHTSKTWMKESDLKKSKTKNLNLLLGISMLAGSDAGYVTQLGLSSSQLANKIYITSNQANKLDAMMLLNHVVVSLPDLVEYVPTPDLDNLRAIRFITQALIDAVSMNINIEQNDKDVFHTVNEWFPVSPSMFSYLQNLRSNINTNNKTAIQSLLPHNCVSLTTVRTFASDKHPVCIEPVLIPRSLNIRAIACEFSSKTTASIQSDYVTLSDSKEPVKLDFGSEKVLWRRPCRENCGLFALGYSLWTDLKDGVTTQTQARAASSIRSGNELQQFVEILDKKTNHI